MLTRLAASLLLIMAAGVAAADDISPGRYVALMGDCTACHTAPGGKAFGGGRAIASPFGDIYSSNITPDPDHGIGDYTLDEFAAAVRRGIRKDGANLYPAMPYTSYAKISDEDIEALYDFFMNEVEPVAEAPPRSELSFPFNQRWGIAAWNLVNRPAVGFTAPFEDDDLSRGAYLVEGLGHCGACHTPRNLLFAQEAYDAKGAEFLAGGTLGDWPVPDLRSADSTAQRWSENELIAFLTTGRNADTGVTGEMKLVVEHSLQYASPADIGAIADYLAAIATDQDEGSPGDGGVGSEPDDTTAMLTAADPGMPLGARLYLDNCGACHTVSGRGAPRTIPNLVGNSMVTADNPGGLISVILRGASMPSTEAAPAAMAMPGFSDRLSDAEVATLASFVRTAWSNAAGTVDETTVAGIRTAQ